MRRVDPEAAGVDPAAVSLGTLSWSLRADVGAPAGARAALNDDRLDGLGPDVRATVALLLSELVTNSVRHAGLTADDEIEVRIEPGDPIRVEVRDPGPGYAVETVAARADGSGGFGLVILDGLASRWGVRGAGPACVWFELDLSERSTRHRAGSPRPRPATAPQGPIRPGRHGIR